MSVACIAKLACRDVARPPDRHMIRFGWICDLPHRCGNKNLTHFFGPQIVFRHVNEAAKCSKMMGSSDQPPRFFHHFAMQSPKRALFRVNAATGQLKVWCGGHLTCQQDLLTTGKQRIGSGPAVIALGRVRAFPKSSDHGQSLSTLLAAPIFSRYANTRRLRKPHETRIETRVGRHCSTIST